MKQLKITQHFAFLSLFILTCLAPTVSLAKDYPVANMQEYLSVSDHLQPGDTVILAPGVWRDAEILFEGEGTPKKPITLKAKTPGKTILSGLSNLRLAGKYLVVSGLVFKNGHTPTGAVISFRKQRPKNDTDYSDVAVHSRVTNTVIDDYNNPSRYETDYWVTLFGKYNRVDHNQFSRKRNKGVLLAVRLDTPQSRENHHLIDHNYFGPRPVMGANGGEIIRIGTSQFSLGNAYVQVRDNYFDHCDGEVEIVSNKSGSNVIKSNVFFESKGTLTLRHGNGNIVENNAFIGNGVDHTGGVRVINGDQTVRDNVFYDLTGYRFGGGFVVMNGVPNSPINRYFQVDNATIKNNTFIDVKHMIFGAGSDKERTLAAKNSRFLDNTILNSDGISPIDLQDSVAGISFKGNVSNTKVPKAMAAGFSGVKPNSKQAKLLDSVASHTYSPRLPVKKSNVGVSWYPKYEPKDRFSGGVKVSVKPGWDTLYKAVKKANSGDVLVLEPGTYSSSKVIQVKKPITITGSGEDATKLNFLRKALFTLNNGGSLTLAKLSVSGKLTPDDRGNAVIRSQQAPMTDNFIINLNRVNIHNLKINKDFDVIQINKNTFADRIAINNSTFSDVTGSVLKADAETDDYGMYGAEYINITDSQFSNIGHGVANVYRGGTDESTFGPHFVMTDSTVTHSGLARPGVKSALFLHGVQSTHVKNNVFKSSAPIVVEHTVGDPKTYISDNTFIDTPKISATEVHFDIKSTAHLSNNTYREEQ